MVEYAEEKIDQTKHWDELIAAGAFKHSKWSEPPAEWPPRRFQLTRADMLYREAVNNYEPRLKPRKDTAVWTWFGWLEWGR